MEVPAPMEIIFELNDNVKTNCTFSPFDIYGHRFGLDTSKLSTFWHMENLIASCQNDFLVIIALRVWLKWLRAKNF